MKVLIISHTVISATGNVGKTLLGYFTGFSPEEVAQLYIQPEVPTDGTACKKYYRFTDRDALRSIWRSSVQGRSFSEKEIDSTRTVSRVDTGMEASVHQFGRKRTAWIYLARNTVWRLSQWFSPSLKEWLRELAPDVIFFASGDYGFMYDIVNRIADFLNVPIVIVCMDDYYQHNRNQNTMLGRMVHRGYMKSVYKMMERASCILCICDAMSATYREMFKKTCYTLYTAVQDRTLSLNPDATAISYIGNLGLNRHCSLIEMGAALNRISPDLFIDVYSGERRKTVLDALEHAPGIRFHEQISADDVIKVMENSCFVIHTEAFDNETMERVKFSVSTKIAESLMYAPCMIAYGPERIASIDYLKEHQAAYVITSPSELQSGLAEIIEDRILQEKIVKNARDLARKNHSIPVNFEKIRGWLEWSIAHSDDASC